MLEGSEHNDYRYDEFDWIFSLKDQIPQFLERLRGKRSRGFYQYSYSGDYFGENYKWGLGNSVFFLKIIYTLCLERLYESEIKDAINFIKSFEHDDGSYYDPLVDKISIPVRIYFAFKKNDFQNISNELTRRAETRQTISTLKLFNERGEHEYRDFPISIQDIDDYLSKLNWELPWGAGSHFSHLLFFLQNSNIENKDELIRYSIDWVNRLQHKGDGFWYKGNPPLKQKINGAMKIITGLKVVNNMNFNNPRKIIDQALMASNDSNACDNFNITYVLKYSNELLDNQYRFVDIEDFMIQRLRMYKKYFYTKEGGFSHRPKGANRCYYGAYITRGKSEPDIHGTVMFLWGISLISQTLGINKDLGFREFVP